MSAVKRRRARRADPAPPPAANDDAAVCPPRRGRPPKHDLRRWRVIDDWPKVVPVTQAEVAVYESWFGDILDELFGHDAPQEADD